MRNKRHPQHMIKKLFSSKRRDGFFFKYDSVELSSAVGTHNLLPFFNPYLNVIVTVSGQHKPAAFKLLFIHE